MPSELPKDMVEAVARVIDPSSWRVMDSYLEQTKRKYAGQNAAYDPDNFKHKESMATAQATIRTLAPMFLDMAAEAAFNAWCEGDSIRQGVLSLKEQFQ